MIDGFENLHADAGRAVDRGCNPHNARGDFDRCAVGPVRSQEKLLAAIHLLIKMEECAGGRDVIRFGRLAPRAAVIGAP